MIQIYLGGETTKFLLKLSSELEKPTDYVM